jgi:hypothetical protein
VECIRGSPSVTWILYLVLFSIQFGAICYIAATMYMVYRSVSNIEIQAQKYSFAAYRSQKNDRKRSRRVMLQGVLYSLALFITNIFSVILMATKEETYVLYVLMSIFWPLQGFFNALIYSIPVFQKMYKKSKEKRKEGQTALSKSEDKKNKCTELSSMNEKKQGAVTLNVACNKASILPSINNKSIESNSKNVLGNNQHNQSAIRTDKAVEEEEGRKEFDGEEEKEEIKKSSETSVTHSGLLIGDNQFQLKRNIESNTTNSIECNSGIHHHGSDVYDGEEIEGGETQRESKYIFTEENVVGGVNNDPDESDYSDDDNNIDDYLILSSRLQ